MYILLKILAALPQAVLHFLARFVAMLAIMLPNSGLKRTVRANILLVYPHLNPEQQTELINASIYNQLINAFDSVKSWGMPTSYSLAQLNHISGQAHLLNALANPHGLILVVPHFGTWELMNAWLNQFASPVIMYKPSKNAGVDRFMLQARQRLNATLVTADESGVRAVFKALKQGGCTVILPDHVPDQSGGIYAQFMGQMVLTTTLVSKLAQKTQCSVLGLSCIKREDDKGFDVICEPFSQDISQPDLQQSVDSLNLDIERIIARAPEQYMWGYKRFKQLASHQDIYKKVI